MELQQNVKLSPADFVKAYLPFAKQTEQKTGFSAIAMLAQGALESGWNKASTGWSLFGVKDTDGVNGNEQLQTTVEYSRRADLKFPVILKITPVVLNGQKYFKYLIQDYFRKYNTPEESFTDHANFFLVNKNYIEAVKVKSDAYKFIDAISKAGYATDVNYCATLTSIAKSVEKIVNQLNVVT